MKRDNWRKTLFIVLGCITLLLGALGLVLPVLPTTPFWLLTAYLFLKSSPRLYACAMSNRVFGAIVKSFQLYHAIPLHAKIISIVMMWGTIIFSSFLIGKLWLTIVLVFISTCVSIHILRYPTLTEELKQKFDNKNDK